MRDESFLFSIPRKGRYFFGASSFRNASFVRRFVDVVPTATARGRSEAAAATRVPVLVLVTVLLLLSLPVAESCCCCCCCCSDAAVSCSSPVGMSTRCFIARTIPLKIAAPRGCTPNVLGCCCDCCCCCCCECAGGLLMATSILLSPTCRPFVSATAFAASA